MSERIHIVLEIPVFQDKLWIIPINGLGSRALENVRYEPALADALREIADEIERGMSFETISKLEDLSAGGSVTRARKLET